MTTPSVRTTTHSYPQEELDAMTIFYGGKRCVILRTLEHVEWAHILNAAALVPCNERLARMLNRNLCQDRHPQHGAEVRENIVPVTVNHHKSMDEIPPRSTLFLHEDILSRTLAYERDVHRWRIVELEAGRGDPGRPTYEQAFGGTPITQHRYHGADRLGHFMRNEGNDIAHRFEIYSNVNCPGIDQPASQSNFPIIDTLLSIPFSLLHTLPRLVGIVPISTYQQQLVAMGLEIVRLWWWDPSPDMILRSADVCCQNLSKRQHNNTRTAQPHPIHHQSRSGTTFSTMQPAITYSTSAPICNFNQDVHTIELPSGQILSGTTPSLSWGPDRLLLTHGDGKLVEMEDYHHADKAGVTESSEAWDVQTPEDAGDYESIDNGEDIEGKPKICPSSFDIISWCEGVVDSGTEPFPLTPTPFEKGVFGGLSVNDVLMIKGLIDPLVYIQFFDLSSFPIL